MIYTIEEVTGPSYEFLNFCHGAYKHLNKIRETDYKWENFDSKRVFSSDRVMICRKREKICGIMISDINNSFFDPMVKVLMQRLLYTTEGKAAYMLMKDFIDFGKRNADHVITMTNSTVNIKKSTLEKWGFKELETFYRLETR